MQFFRIVNTENNDNIEMHYESFMTIYEKSYQYPLHFLFPNSEIHSFKDLNIINYILDCIYIFYSNLFYTLQNTPNHLTLKIKYYKTVLMKNSSTDKWFTNSNFHIFIILTNKKVVHEAQRIKNINFSSNGQVPFSKTGEDLDHVTSTLRCSEDKSGTLLHSFISKHLSRPVLSTPETEIDGTSASVVKISWSRKTKSRR